MARATHTKHLWSSYTKAVLGAVIAALAVRFFLVEAFRIPTPLMRPTLEPGDVIFAWKPPFGFRIPGLSVTLLPWREPRYGEVVVFSGLGGADSIRRVLAKGGDTVEIKQGRVWVNGAELAFQPGPVTGCGMEIHPQGPQYSVCQEEPRLDDMTAEKVPPGQVYLLGDLRRQAPRSAAGPGVNRSWSMVPFDQMKATAMWVWLSVDPERSKLRKSRIFKTIR